MSMPIQINNETYLDTAEAMKHLGVSRPTLENLVSSGKLPRYKQGIRKTHYYKQDDLNELLRPKRDTER